MHGDWIKMRTDLYRDPKVCVMADQLLDEDGPLARYVSQLQMRDMTVTRNVMRNVTVGALVTVWGVTRHRGKRNGDDLLLRGVTLDVVDDIADLPGFGYAMSAVAWAEETEEGVVFPRFFAEFNVDPGSEGKEKAAERQRRYRAKRNAKSNVTRDVTVTSQSNARERVEKSREESNTHTHTQKTKSQQIEIPDSLHAEGFPEAWQRWLDWIESTQPRPMDPIRQEQVLIGLANRGAEKAARDIAFSIEKDAKSILDSDNDFQASRGGGHQKRSKLDL